MKPIAGAKPITNKILAVAGGLYSWKGDSSLSEDIAITSKGSYSLSGKGITLTKSGTVKQNYALLANKGSYKTATVIFFYHGIYGVTLKPVGFSRGRVLSIKHGKSK